MQAREEKERKKRELEEEQSPVTYLSDADFDGSGALKEQLKQQRLLIKFYAPWCGHCKQLAPTWEKMALDEELAGRVVVAKADCTGKASTACNDQDIHGYPHIKLMEGDEEMVYEGDREFEALKAFALSSSIAEAKEEADM